MKKILLLLASVILCLILSSGLYAEGTDAVRTLPPVIAQAAGPAFTIVMWHDINDDGKSDYRATYAFKGGKLHLLDRSPSSSEYPGSTIIFVN
jgi:hypothetical protein